MKNIIIIMLVLVLVACSSGTPSAGDIQTAIANTQAAQPTETPLPPSSNTPLPTQTNTPVPTNTPRPTNTPLPTVTPTKTPSLDETRDQFVQLITKFLENGEGFDDIENVNLVRIQDGELQIEVKTL